MSQRTNVLVIPKGKPTQKQEAFITKVALASSLCGTPLAVVSAGDSGQAEELEAPFLKAADLILFSGTAAVEFILGDMQAADFKGPTDKTSAAEAVALFGDLHAGLLEAGPDESLAAWMCQARQHKAAQDALRLLPEHLREGRLGRRTNVKDGLGYEYDWSKTRLPESGRRNVLITAALPYVNNVPHLGNVIGAVLSADVYARFCRQRGDQVVYVCGTDEFGTTTETKALEEGLSCEDLCAKYFKLHAATYDWFQIAFDHFGRTTNKYQTAITHDIFRALVDNGFFFEDSVEQTFCQACDRFLADRFVEGTCPFCAFPDARGDQCDGCGKLINTVELKDARCKLCKSTPVIRSSKHFFLDLTKLQPRIEGFVEAASQKGCWSANSVSISKAWLAEGLRPRCMTRDLKWGTPVPVAGFEDKVFYVWFDAPIGYLSITADYLQSAEAWKAWWKNSEQVELVQFMGKDNVPFHTVTFPATLLGTDMPFTLLHHISTTEYLNYESGKFSKSRGTGVFGTDARASGIPASVWRYYLLATRPEGTDSTFSWDDFAAKTNGELLANLGNFVNRTSKFLQAKLDGTIGKQSRNGLDEAFIAKVNAALRLYLDAMDRVQLKAALKEVMAISALGNHYLTEARLDGKLLASDPERCRSVLSLALNLVYLLSALLEPFLPSTAADICTILGAPALRIPTKSWDSEALLPGHQIGEPFHLFHRIEDAQLAQLRARFAGKSAAPPPSKAPAPNHK